MALVGFNPTQIVYYLFIYLNSGLMTRLPSNVMEGEAVTNFEHSTYQGEIILDSNVQGIKNTGFLFEIILVLIYII